MSSHVARKVVQCFHRPHSGTPATETLSQRERQVLDLAARGYAFKEVAETLEISVTTVGTHIRRIYEKLHVHSRSQAVAAYTQPALGDAAWRALANRTRPTQ